jgi:hypothetical protein
LKLSTPCILAINQSFLFQLNAHNILRAFTWEKKKWLNFLLFAFGNAICNLQATTSEYKWKAVCLN